MEVFFIQTQEACLEVKGMNPITKENIWELKRLEKTNYYYNNKKQMSSWKMKRQVTITTTKVNVIIEKWKDLKRQVIITITKTNVKIGNWKDLKRLVIIYIHW